MAKKPKADDGRKAKGKAGPKASKPARIAKKAGKQILGLANSELGREILADALMAAANAAASALLRVSAKGTKLGIADLKEEAALVGKDFARTATGALANVVVDAARRMMPEEGEAAPALATPATPAQRRPAARAPKSVARTPARGGLAARKGPAVKGGARKAAASKAAGDEPAAGSRKTAVKRAASKRPAKAQTAPETKEAPEGDTPPAAPENTSE